MRIISLRLVIVKLLSSKIEWFAKPDCGSPFICSRVVFKPIAFQLHITALIVGAYAKVVDTATLRLF